MVTDIFDDEKILLIESMPEHDAIIVIWFKLLCLAGKSNNNGVLTMGNIAYTDEMLATIFRRPLNVVRLALETFERFGMIQVINNAVTIPNWNKHQDFSKLEARNEYMRKYMREKREKQAEIAEKSSCKVNSKSNVNVNVNINKDINVNKQSANSKVNCKPNVNCAERDRDKDIDIEKEREYREKKSLSRTPHGTYQNVFLSEQEFSNLHRDYPDADQKIERLSEYMASSGRTYADHCATIRKWAKEDSQKGKRDTEHSRSYDLEEFERMIELPPVLED